MDLLESIDGYKIYIDYAHTPDALQNVLETLKNLD
jgi:UDP-N-acetylmuramyl tripeptide synthase